MTPTPQPTGDREKLREEIRAMRDETGHIDTDALLALIDRERKKSVEEALGRVVGAQIACEILSEMFPNPQP